MSYMLDEMSQLGLKLDMIAVMEVVGLFGMAAVYDDGRGRG